MNNNILPENASEYICLYFVCRGNIILRAIAGESAENSEFKFVKF